MLNDKHNVDGNDADLDLNDMITEYGEDNELRRKINELKKQKDDSTSNPSESVSYSDLSFEKKSTRFNDIRIDEDVDKTRVGFSDDNDKTLVIMGSKNKSAPVFEDEEDVILEAEALEENTQDMNKTNVFSTQELNAYEHEDDEEPTKKRNKKEQKEKLKEEDDEEDSEKNAKTNKIITYVIIGIVAVCIIVGGFFGVKYFLLGDSKSSKDDKKTTETTKKPTNDKNDNKDKDSDKTDIKDNSAIVKQLTTQRDTDQEQLDAVIKDIATATAAQAAAQANLDNIGALKSAAETLAGQAKTLEDNKKSAESLYNNAKAKFGENSAEAAAAKIEKDKANTAYENDYNQTKNKSDLTMTEYNTEYSKTGTYKKNIADGQAKIDSLNKEKTSLEAKIAELNTKLNSYK
ncbi:MAG: hypothetical protein RR624_09690 [Longicatena sp.]